MSLATVMRKENTKPWWGNQSLATVSNMNIHKSLLDTAPDFAYRYVLVIVGSNKNANGFLMKCEKKCCGLVNYKAQNINEIVKLTMSRVPHRGE